MAYLGSTPARAPLSSAQIEDGTIDTADLATNAVTTAKIADANITAAKVSSDVSQLGKNLIQNGAMTVAQKGSLALGSGGTTTQIAVDRWKVGEGGGAARFTVTQDTDSPTGFSNSIKIDCTTADTSIAGADYAALQQGIEAQNLQHLGYAAAGSLGTTLSFRVKSPKAGIHCVGLTQLDEERYYIREYTVASADTWETHSVYFPGDDAGTITNDTGEGLRVFFALHGAGANQGNGVKDAWTVWPSSVIKYMTANQVNVFDNTANNFFLSGVQLEVGSVATDFEHEDYGTTLTKCLRYFWRWTGDADNDAPGLIHTCNTTRGVSEFQGVPMRAAPTVSLGGTVPDMPDATGGTVVSLNVTQDDQNFGNHMIHCVLSSATADESSRLRFATADTDYIQWSAEL